MPSQLLVTLPRFHKITLGNCVSLQPISPEQAALEQELPFDIHQQIEAIWNVLKEEDDLRKAECLKAERRRSKKGETSKPGEFIDLSEDSDTVQPPKRTCLRNYYGLLFNPHTKDRALAVFSTMPPNWLSEGVLRGIVEGVRTRCSGPVPYVYYGGVTDALLAWAKPSTTTLKNLASQLGSKGAPVDGQYCSLVPTAGGLANNPTAQGNWNGDADPKKCGNKWMLYQSHHNLHWSYVVVNFLNKTVELVDSYGASLERNSYHPAEAIFA